MNLHNILTNTPGIVLWVTNRTHTGRCRSDPGAGPRGHHACADRVLSRFGIDTGTIYCECIECLMAHQGSAHYIRSRDDNSDNRYQCDACLSGYHPEPPR